MARLGAKVTVVEFLDRILPGMDGEVAKQFQRMLEKQGIAFKLGAKVTGVDSPGAALKVTVEPAAGGAAETLEADVVLVAIGRMPYTDGLGLERSRRRARRARPRRRSTRISRPTCRASTPSATSIAGPMLAHKAEDEGVAVAEIIAGQAGHVNYDVIPGVVYTSPEVASVGKTEEELKAGRHRLQGRQVPVHRQRPRQGQPDHRRLREDPGRRQDRPRARRAIVGRDAGEMIHEAAVLMEFGGSAEDLARTCHAHPTRSEAVKEAALAVGKRAIHM